MSLTILKTPATLLPSREAADVMVRTLKHDDPDWNYVVHQRGDNFAIVVSDDEGMEFGAL